MTVISLNNMSLSFKDPLIHGFFPINTTVEPNPQVVELKDAKPPMQRELIMDLGGLGCGIWGAILEPGTKELPLLPSILFFFVRPSIKHHQGNKSTKVSWRSMMCQKPGWNLDMTSLIHSHSDLEVKHYYSRLRSWTWPSTRVHTHTHTPISQVKRQAQWSQNQ